MGIGKGLKFLRKDNNMTMEELANDLNNKYPNTMKLTKGKISKWENEKEEPRLSSAKILAEYFNVKINDLYDDATFTTDNSSDITTIYDQLTPPRQNNVLDFAKHQLYLQSSMRSNIIDINTYKNEQITEVLVHRYTSAGTGEQIFDEPAFTVYVKGYIPPHDIALQVNGDSMEPVFKDKEIIFIEKSYDIKNGQIGVFVINGEAYVKKVYAEEDRLTLISLNKEYPDLHFYENEGVKLVGKVIL
ncbi:XRE family transcriptional regulator [Staphylococcus auricularis]|uniref:helix-turn-helix domain-containing protein n=1 Tax=Staphylococcus auricularis TaxID=29379 RepID=UPI001EF208ED|nr:XRE family transcriptional regulator [Staphylococcus auricularis]MCG7342343.1 XRE family transcriptional regulator [Staphylococcus auricularis]